MKHLYFIMLAVGCPFLSDAQSVGVDSLQWEYYAYDNDSTTFSSYSDDLHLDRLSTELQKGFLTAVDSLRSSALELIEVETMLLKGALEGEYRYDSAELNSIISNLTTFENQFSKNEIRIDNYYQSKDTSSNLQEIQYQTVAEFSRSQSLLGVDVRLGGQFYMNDGRADLGRSGISLALDRHRYLEDIQEISGVDPIESVLDRFSYDDPAILLARQEEFSRQYLQVTRTPAYRKLYSKALEVTDSLRGYYEGEFDELSREYIALNEKLSKLRSYHRNVLTELQNASPEFRNRGLQRLDSLRNLLAIDHERNLLEELRQRMKESKQYTTLQRLALFARRFSVGNTRLPADGQSGIGLPIRGIDFAYERAGIGIEAQFGQRILSQRYTPRDGFVFHDLQRGMQLGRIGLSYTGRDDRFQLRFSATNAIEKNSNRGEAPESSNTAAGTLPVAPRSNQVVAVNSRSKLNSVLDLTGELSYASTQPRGEISPPNANTPPSSDETSDISWRVGVGIQPSEAVHLGIVGFYTGLNYKSFANPYQYTDYKGVEVELKTNNLANFLDASFSLSGGNGTSPSSRENYRWRAQGQVNARLSRSSSLIAIFSPNVYRYTVTGKEGLSESSIYQLLYSYADTEEGPSIQLGLTNFNQGLTWADSSATTKNVVAIWQGEWPLSPGFSLTTRGQKTFGQTSADQVANEPEEGKNMPSATYNYGLGARFKNGGHRITLSVDYGRFGPTEPTGIGANVDYSCSLGDWATLRVSAYFRPTTVYSSDRTIEPTTTNQLFSQQSWWANF